MKGTIVIDMGTTNTRIRYMEAGEIKAAFKDRTGVRNRAISGSGEALKDCVKRGIASCLSDCGRSFSDVDGIVAYGMITSNLGLLEVPHKEAPAGVLELSAGMREMSFPEIAPLPISFIPGVKNRVEGPLSRDNFEGMDMMRGEETEALGALRLCAPREKMLYISPGSHTKFVFTDENQKITGCSTTLAGELLWALSAETILADSIPDSLISRIEEDFIRRGMEDEERYGLTRTCFLTRILDVFTDASPNQRANYIAGAIAGCDVRSLQTQGKLGDTAVVLGGNDSLSQLYRTALLDRGCDKERIRVLSHGDLEKASAAAALDIFCRKSCEK